MTETNNTTLAGEDVLRIATRRSQLALTQSGQIADRLRAARPGARVELVEVVTSGDRIQDRALREIGGKALFTKEIEEALLDGRADIAIHSLKDLPTELPPGLELLVVPVRENPRDALVCNEPWDSLESLPQGARVGTGSLRRGGLLLRARPDLEIVALRGNVDTRLRKLRESGEMDAIVLAEAGMRRLGLDVKRSLLDPETFVPAACQGALGIEAAVNRPEIAWVKEVLAHEPTRLAAEAERAYLAEVEGSCKVPVAAHASWADGQLSMTACVTSEEGDVVQVTLPPTAVGNAELAREVGREAARRVRLAGGEAIIARYTDPPTPLGVHGGDPLVELGAGSSTALGMTAEPSLTHSPTVYLVGAGPGDSGLITVRGKTLLEQAGAVVYDSLANHDLLTSIHTDAERHFVGKRAGRHSATQDEICALLVDLAGRHETVVRLKGGDPFLFGRGGEEAEALADAGVHFELVPGVTAGIAAAAYAGVPLSHRDLASSVTFLTGHTVAEGRPRVDWESVAKQDTVVLYMSVARAAENFSALLAAGRPGDDPVVAVEWASFPRQRILRTTLADAAETMTAAAWEAPSVIVVGAVAGLHDKLAWFERNPLYGRRVLVTRSAGQASRLSLLLYQAGATPVEVPALEICPVEGDERERLHRSLRDLASYQWVVFTSPNGVRHAFEACLELGLDARAFAGCTLATIGTVTGRTLRECGLSTDLVPKRFDAEGLLEAMPIESMDGARVLVLRAREARPVVIEGLRSRGAQVDDVATYYTCTPDDLEARLSEALDERLDLLTFASSKTVRNLVDAAGERAAELLAVPAACIGPICRRSATRLGFDVVVQPPVYTIDALIDSIRLWAESREP